MKGIKTVLKKILMNKGKGQLLYKKAKNIIPGGTMLLSKRPEMFLPDKWPAYYKKTDGCHVFDLDDNKLMDFYLMGVGTNILGYNNVNVNNAVIKAVNSGNMSSLNCFEEVELAERLIDLHPWAQMVRFARTGGEANSIAVRIARAASGKDKVAICGYHGWHDWYLSANLKGSDSLKTHLLPGLDTLGVPKNLEGSVIPFQYNDLDEIKKIVSSNPDLGAIKMEVSRNFGPNEGYLEGIRKLCDQHEIVLIFDECTSGFRETFGGLHKKYNVEPDMCIFGKALGNGYAITSIIGKRSVMSAAEKSFISSTFWTERIGCVSAIATLKEMEKVKSWDTITTKGKQISKRWQELGAKYNLKLSTSGIPALSSFSIDSKDWLKYKTYITQEMLEENILAGNSVYVCIAHEEELIDTYFSKIEPIFSNISKFENGELLIDDHLKYPVCHSSFKRLN